MTDKKLGTDSYKGVRDFYPLDMAVQRYIFNSWAQTAESFGFARYDASILEPAELYKAKGVENEEMVNEQTYTFIDRGDREVTLRPEMTPTVARMIARERRELSFPVRWYSIPNLFRYERPQRGRLREHWQLNCDIFGGDTVAADTEMIQLAYQLLLNFGATPEMFEIRINDRQEMCRLYSEIGITDESVQNQVTRINDRYHKITIAEYREALQEILNPELVAAVVTLITAEDQSLSSPLVQNLQALGIQNLKVDRSLARGFDYYTGVIFEIFDIHPGGSRRSMLGGGRYDNLTAMFSAEPVSGVGFGMGDVTMRDFLETHQLLPKLASTTAPHLMIVPMDTTVNLEATKIAQQFRAQALSVAVDFSDKKLGRKIADAANVSVRYVLVVGVDELTSGQYTLKNLADGTTTTGTIEDLISFVTTKN